MQCNIQQTDASALAVRHVHDVAKSGDLIGWNEAGTDEIRHSIAALPSFASFIPPDSAGSVPISWRTDVFELLGTHVEKVHGGVEHITPSRYVVSVQLRHRPSGVTFIRANTHVVHHIEIHGVARTASSGAITGQQARARMHFMKLHDLLVAWSKHGPVILGGDFNVDYFADRHARKKTPYFPYTELGSVATFAMPKHGTHGARCIDWTVLAGDVRSRENRVLPHGSSDHNPTLNMIELTLANPGKETLP